MIISGLYLSLFILSVLALVLLFSLMSSRRESYYSVLFTLITVVCLAYFSYSISIDEGMALVSNQFTYFDGTFIMMFFIFCIMDIVGVKINRRILVGWITLGVTFLLLPFTASHNGLFYKSYNLKVDYGASHLVMEFGPLHTPFMVYVFINMLLPFVVVAISFFYKRRISYKISLILSGLLVAIIGIYFFQQIIGLGFDLLPLGYVMIEYVILYIIRRVSLYDPSQIIIEANRNDNVFGCIIFDQNKKYAGADNTAKYYFPELMELGLDRTIKDEYLENEFVKWLDNMADTPSKVIERKNRKILCTAKEFSRTFVANKNKIYGYIIELHDDTEQQNLIEQLNETNEELAQTVEIANNANKAKSQFLANMSHEIRTPINAILGMNELAMRKCDDEELLEYMHDIENAGHSLMGIINDLLDFSRIEAGKIEIINEEYDLARLIKETEDMIAVRAKQKSIAFDVDLAKDVPSVLLGDEKRIRQVMVNLLNNAVKYTHDGKVDFNIWSEIKDDNHVNLHIKVSDTGIGIKESDIVHLFERFSRVDEKVNKSIEGTGLGLAITQKLVKLMQGEISVSSQYGKGSEFYVVIPQVIVDKTPVNDYKEKYRQSIKEKEISSFDGNGKYILAVDDNFINLKIAEGLLEPTKANVTLAESGKEALELMEKQHYDVILLDHMMPEMDGIEVLAEAKKRDNSLCRDSKYIVLTANAISGVSDEYKEAGFDDYLSKPIDPQKFIATIGKYLV